MDIVIHIDKYRAAKRISGAYLTHNSDIRIVVSADPESGFDLSQPTSMIVVTARGEYPPITASGGVFAAPLLTREDLPEGVRVGFTQGSVRTTRGANMDLIRTISDHHGVSADPHADEYDRVIDEITLADKLLVERASDGYRGAALISALIEYLPAGAEGKSAYELAVEDGYEGTLEEWLTSLIGDKGDRGAAGADGFSPTASVVKYNGVITIAITDKNGTTTATLTECDLAFVTTGHSYAQLQTLYEAGKRLVLVVTAGRGNDKYIWLDFYSQPDFIFVAPNGYGYTEYICREAVGWLTVNHGLDSAPAQNSTNPVTSGGIYATLGNKQDTISDLDTIRSGAAAGATAVQPAAIADMATQTWVGQQGYLKQHQSLADYRTATVQNAIDGAQDTAIAGKLSTSGTAYKSASIPMGAVDSTSTSTAFTATVAGITELRDGVCMWLKNGIVSSAEGFTVNVNNLGAKPVYHNMGAAAAVTTTFNINYTMLFIYNSTRVTGGCWDMVYGYNKDTTYTPVKLGFGYTTCSTAAATAAKTASLSSYALTTGGIVAIKFDNDVPANATLNISSKGAKAIYYHGAAITAGVIKAGDTVTFMYSTQYHVLSIDRDDAPVTSVNGQTGAVMLDADDVGATPETFLVTVTASNGSYSADKTFAEISAAYAAGKRLMASFPVPFNDEYVNALNPLVPATYGPYVVAYGSYIVMSTATGVMQYQLGINNSGVDVSVSAIQSPYMTTTLTIATTDWHNGSCTKTVIGMTAGALVFVRYSDTETEFTEAQGSNFLTFTAATTPSEAVTVYVAWLVKEDGV